jgi:DNA invertase Pin-like site-specific DNA recombinase
MRGSWWRHEGVRVYGEKVSGAKTDRAELAKLLKRLEPGDALMVTRLDRLARSTRDLLNILHTLGERGIGFKSLADAWADTTRLSCDGDACPAENWPIPPLTEALQTERYYCSCQTTS